MARRVAVCCVLTLALAASARAQSGSSGTSTGQSSQTSPAASSSTAEETRPATTTFNGDTGLWFVPTAEVLGKGQLSASVYRRATNWVQGYTNVADFAGTFAKAGEAVTPGEFGLLVMVERNTGLSQMALAHALGIDRSTLVPILDRLQARGLLVRRASPTDGRTHALGLTPAGEKALAKFARLVKAHEKRIASRLSASETRTLIELLENFGMTYGPTRTASAT